MAATISASMIKAPLATRQQAAVSTKAVKPALVSNVSAKKAANFQVWTPINNKVRQCSALVLIIRRICM